MGCGGSVQKGEGSPCLNEYFEELRKFQDEEIADLKKLAKLKKDKNAAEQKVMITQIKSKRQAFKKVREQLLADSFQHHDKSGDGKLSVEESKILFNHITLEKRGHDVILANDSIRKELLTDLGMNKMVFENIEIPSEEDLKKQYDTEEKKEAEMQYEDVKKRSDALYQDYLKNKEKRDDAAFLVLDKSRDGKINKKEFFEAFDPTSPTHVAFYAALGLSSEVEVKNMVGADTTKKDKEAQVLAAQVQAGESKLDASPAAAPAAAKAPEAAPAAAPAAEAAAAPAAEAAAAPAAEAAAAPAAEAAAAPAAEAAAAPAAEAAAEPAAA